MTVKENQCSMVVPDDHFKQLIRTYLVSEILTSLADVVLKLDEKIYNTNLEEKEEIAILIKALARKVSSEYNW